MEAPARACRHRGSVEAREDVARGIGRRVGRRVSASRVCAAYGMCVEPRQMSRIQGASTLYIAQEFIQDGARGERKQEGKAEPPA